MDKKIIEQMIKEYKLSWKKTDYLSGEIYKAINDDEGKTLTIDDVLELFEEMMDVLK